MRNTVIIIILVLLVGYALLDTHGDHSYKNAVFQQEDEAIENIPIGNKIGERAPNMMLPDVYGNFVRLSDFRGKKVFVNFWVTWCPPCRAEMPDLQRIYEEYDGDVIVLGVNLTKAEASVADVHSFTREHELTFPILLDQEGQAIDAYRIVSYPTTFLVNEAGVIDEVVFGAIHYETMKEMIGK